MSRSERRGSGSEAGTEPETARAAGVVPAAGGAGEAARSETGRGGPVLEGSVFHLLGVGGAGMSVVARLLAARGARVSGSDAQDSPALRQLTELGLDVRVGHQPSQVPTEAVVVVSSAIRQTNPELQVARQRGQEVIHRSEALALAAQGTDFVAVAGAHGKTTTSGMLAEALTLVGADPSFAVGGVVRALGTGAHLGSGRAFVAEADESDRSFLNYRPRVELVTNVEPDHLDSYGTTEAFEEAFADFARCMVPGGLLVACADDEGSLRLALSAAQEGLRVVTYSSRGVEGLPGEALLGEGHVHLEVHERTEAATWAAVTLTMRDSHGVPSTTGPVPLRLSVPGDHVALDAAGAWAVGLELGVDPEAMAQALGAFSGTGRRFEDRGEAAGVRVIDDYAHHPTEVEALLRTAREVARSRHGRVLVLFQPHLYSRTRAFAQRFGEALALADTVVVTGIYPARETQADFPEVSGAMVVDQVVQARGQGGGAPAAPGGPGGRGHSARYVPDRCEAARTLASAARPGDVLLTVGAGDVTELGATVLEHLEASAAPQGRDDPSSGGLRD
ncbi:UDP-N-acetylmuramate--L-alanine ligase [Actinomyces wuliandei]|uniref:UDP-N-acetylmuramate--L-alanine ligase n=1 Tax=Actinomyces wuliandei TaxID=2057743 RepID=UPI00111A5551|nr:UDP-N-acetylmuramate--L-alanine ligase [Actinomyces wuliandei]